MILYLSLNFKSTLHKSLSLSCVMIAQGETFLFEYCNSRFYMYVLYGVITQLFDLDVLSVHFIMSGLVFFTIYVSYLDMHSITHHSILFWDFCLLCFGFWQGDYLTLLNNWQTNPWDSVLLEKLVKKFSHILWNQMVHCHILWNLPFACIFSQMNPIHAILSYFYQIQINIIANLCLVLQSGLCPSVFCTKPSVPSFLPHMYPVPCTSHRSSCAYPNSIGWGVGIMKLLIFQFSHASFCFFLHRPSYFLEHTILEHPESVF